MQLGEGGGGKGISGIRYPLHTTQTYNRKFGAWLLLFFYSQTAYTHVLKSIEKDTLN